MWWYSSWWRAQGRKRITLRNNLWFVFLFPNLFYIKTKNSVSWPVVSVCLECCQSSELGKYQLRLFFQFVNLCAAARARSSEKEAHTEGVSSCGGSFIWSQHPNSQCEPTRSNYTRLLSFNLIPSFVWNILVPWHVSNQISDKLLVTDPSQQKSWLSKNGSMRSREI